MRTGTNYVTEIFTMIGQGLSAGFTWFQTILTSIGLPWAVFSLILIGFAITTFLVSNLLSQFRDSADSAVRMTTNKVRNDWRKGNQE